MAKKSSKKTQNKELKPEIQDKKEELVFPNTPIVKIFLAKDGKESSKKQSMKDRRDESKGMKKAKGKGAYSSDPKMS